jgi:hypothetical protein
MARFREATFREAAFSGIKLGIIIYPPAILQERGFKLVFYNTLGEKIGEIGSDIKNTPVSDVGFELMDFGCGAFNFILDDIPLFNITYRTMVSIHPYFDPVPWFTGFIQKMPDPGTKRPVSYSGFGFFDQLDWITITHSFGPQDVSAIVGHIIETIVAPQTQIVYNIANIETTGYTTSGTIDFDHVPAKDAIQALADIAQNFEFGVDNLREFYFRALDTTEKKAAWRGKHFQDTEVKIDPLKIRNKLYIKMGTIQPGGSNIISPPLSNAASIAAYGLREEVVTAPDILGTADAVQWGTYILNQKKDPVTQVKIIEYFLDSDKNKIEARGKIRLTTEDGAEYSLPIKRVTYTISTGGIMADIELGQIDVPFEWHLLEILRKIQEESRLADKRTKQLA